MNLKNLFPLIDVEEVNALLRKGWSLLLVYSSPDRDLEGYDQRNGRTRRRECRLNNSRS